MEDREVFQEELGRYKMRLIWRRMNHQIRLRSALNRQDYVVLRDQRVELQLKIVSADLLHLQNAGAQCLRLRMH